MVEILLIVQGCAQIVRFVPSPSPSSPPTGSDAAHKYQRARHRLLRRLVSYSQNVGAVALDVDMTGGSGQARPRRPPRLAPVENLSAAAGSNPRTAFEPCGSRYGWVDATRICCDANPAIRLPSRGQR